MSPMCVIQVYVGDTAGLVPDPCNKASIVIKQAVIFLLGEGPAFNL